MWKHFFFFKNTHPCDQGASPGHKGTPSWSSIVRNRSIFFFLGGGHLTHCFFHLKILSQPHGRLLYVPREFCYLHVKQTEHIFLSPIPFSSRIVLFCFDIFLSRWALPSFKFFFYVVQPQISGGLVREASNDAGHFDFVDSLCTASTSSGKQVLCFCMRDAMNFFLTLASSCHRCNEHSTLPGLVEGCPFLSAMYTLSLKRQQHSPMDTNLQPAHNRKHLSSGNTLLHTRNTMVLS